MFRVPLLLGAIICLGALGSVGPADAGSATITVDTTSDNNLTACTAAPLDCSLRGALNIATPNDTINFAITATCFGDTCGISVGSQLPPIDDAGVTINGYTQPNAVPNSAGPGQPTNAALKVVVNGTNCGFNCQGGLIISADNVTIKGLDIILFKGSGIQINDADNAVIEGNWSGVSVLGLAAGNEGGVGMFHGAGNRIGGATNAARNVISGNSSGIAIGGEILSPATNNLIQGNLVGLNPAGSAALGNTFRGITLSLANDNIIGGSTPGARNVVSGQGSEGIAIVGTSAGNTVIGNYVGTDITGAVGLGNEVGIVFSSAGTGNTVGGDSAGERNIISGNDGDGVLVLSNEGPQAMVGNFIGTDPAGTAAVPNAGRGVYIKNSQANIIGGTTAGARNIISGNDGNGIQINLGGTANTIQGNYIGTDASGTAAIPNGGRGVYVTDSQNNIIGGTTPGARNVISGNDANGIHIYHGGTASNTIQGNYIGTNAAGDAALPNGGGGGGGVVLEDTDSNLIGGTAAGSGNLISGNAKGIFVTGGADNEVYGNFVGTNAAGDSAIPNTQEGIDVDSTANTIGTTGGGRNLISGNDRSGVYLLAGDGNHVTGNLIGITLGGAPLGNGSHGVDIEFADNSLVEDNTIAYNGDASSAGVLVPVGTGNTITANSIHSNGGLGIDVFHESDGIGGVSPNDPGDADTGGNNAQNFPELTSAIAGSLTVEGFLDSTPHTHFRLEFFANDACDSSNHGEGQTFLGATNLFLDIDGVTEFAASINADPQPDDFLTSTATNLTTGDTSEFSACIEIEAAPTTPTPTPIDTPDLTPTPSPTPTGTPSSNLVQGDVNCDGGVDQDDFQFLIEFAAGLNDGTTPDPCPDLGEALPAGTGGHPWGDVNCDGFVNGLDALYVLASTVDIELPHPGCPAIGSVLT